jgi:hypothetical protein
MSLTPDLALQPATEEDVPFLLSLRKRTMTAHLQRAGAPHDDDHHLARIHYHFDDAQIVWLAGRPAGLFKHYRDPAGWRIVQIQIDPDFQGQGLYEALGFTSVKETELEHEMRYDPGAVRPGA